MLLTAALTLRVAFDLCARAITHDSIHESSVTVLDLEVLRNSRYLSMHVVTIDKYDSGNQCESGTQWHAKDGHTKMEQKSARTMEEKYQRTKHLRKRIDLVEYADARMNVNEVECAYICISYQL